VAAQEKPKVIPVDNLVRDELYPGYTRSGQVTPDYWAVDWASGRNRFGYVTPGLSFATTQHSNLYTGYSIGNQGRRNNALFAYYGITF